MNNTLKIRPNWRNSIKQVWTAEEGSVCFVKFTNDVIFVVKGSSRVVQETFAASVLISAGLPCAAIRVVNSRDKEWGDIKSSLLRYTTRKEVEETEKVKIKNLLGGPLDRAQIMVIEYIEGTSFDMLYGDKLASFLAKKDVLKKNCRTCGQILAVDIFLQNSDRIPTTVWQNDGNGGNLMINTRNEIFAIDSLITTVDPLKEKSKKYFERKKEYLLQFFKEVSMLYQGNVKNDYDNSTVIEKFKAFFLRYTRHTLDQTCLQAFIEGIVEGCLRIVTLFNMNYFQKLYDHMSRMFTQTWNNGWAKDLKLVHLKFLEMIAPDYISFVEDFKEQFPNIKVQSYFPVKPSTQMVAKKYKPPKIKAAKKPKAVGSVVSTARRPPPPLKFSPSDLSGLKNGLKKNKLAAPKVQAKAAAKRGIGVNKMVELKNKTTQLNMFEDQCMKLFSESNSILYTMHRDSTIESALKTFDLLDSDIVFVDFDQTLTMPQKVKVMGVKAKLRGGLSTKLVLNTLKEAKKTMFVLTANPPTSIAASSVVGEVRHLGLANIFACEELAVNCIQEQVENLGITDNIPMLTKQAILLLALLTSRTGEDLYRIAASTIEVNKPVMTFKLFQEDISGNIDVNQLSTKQQVKNMFLCELIEKYMAITQTKDIAPTCLLKKDKEGAWKDISKVEVVSLLQEMGESLKLSSREVHHLCYGEAISYNTSQVAGVHEKIQNVKLASSGNVICSKYNKAEAIDFVLSLLSNDSITTDKIQFYFEDLELLQKKKKLKITFIDDNASNAFTVFQYFAKRQDVKVNSLWYTPPLVGSNELKQDDPLEKIVSKLSLLSLRNIPANQIRRDRKGLNVLLVQEGPMPIAVATKKMVTLVEEKRNNNDQVSFVIFPEGFISENIIESKDDQEVKNTFQPLAEAAKKLKVNVIAGTFREVLSNSKYYTSSVFISSKGEILCKYRKQKVHNFEYQAYGSTNAVFDTEFGRVAILICLDIEDEGLLKSVIADGARIIFNPVHIPLRKTTKGKENQEWRYKLQSMAKYLEKVCADTGVTVVRCDMPYPHGCGTTQVITPTLTETISTRTAGTLLFNLQGTQLDKLFCVTPTNSYERTDNKDNVGLRVCAQNFFLGKNVSPLALKLVLSQQEKFKFYETEIILWQSENKMFSLNARSLVLSNYESKKSKEAIQFPFLNSNIHTLKDGIVILLHEGCLTIANITPGSILKFREKIYLSFYVESFVLSADREMVCCLGKNQVCMLSITHNRISSPVEAFLK